MQKQMHNLWLCFRSTFASKRMISKSICTKHRFFLYSNRRQFLAQCFLYFKRRQFILHIYCLEGNIHFFRVLKSKIETNPLFGGNVFSPVMNLLHANPQMYFFLSTLRLENMLSFDSASCLPSVEMSWIGTVFEMMEEFFIALFKTKM